MLDHPLSPGATSAIEPGPWHYGADYVTVYFDADPGRLDGLLPSGFKADGGLCLAYVCEIVSVSDKGADIVATQPDRTLYHEAALGVKCKWADKPGVFFPVMWVTTDWSLLRGLLNGYQKRLADKISMTKLHPLNPGLRPAGAGSKFSGFCVKGSTTTHSVNVNVDRVGSQSDLPSCGSTFGMRRLPQTHPSQGEVSEPVRIIKSNSMVSDVWLGAGSLQTSLEVGDISPRFGAVYKSGFTISGSEVLNP